MPDIRTSNPEFQLCRMTMYDFSDTILITGMSTFHVLGVDLVERCKRQGFKVFCHLMEIGCRGFGTK